MNRECSAVGKTQRALWSWLIRPQPLDPGRVQEVVLGRVLLVESGRARLRGRQALGQLHVPVDRVADEVDGGEEQAPPAAIGRGGRVGRYGTQTLFSLVHRERLPRRSAAWTRNPYQWPCGRPYSVSAVLVVSFLIVRQAPPSTRYRTSNERRPAVWVWSRGS